MRKGIGCLRGAEQLSSGADVSLLVYLAMMALKGLASSEQGGVVG